MDYETDVIIKFRNAVDNTSWPTKILTSNEVDQKLNELGLPSKEDGSTHKTLSEFYKNKIIETLDEGKGTSASMEFSKISSHLNYQRIIFDKEYIKYINIANLLFDITRSDCLIENLQDINFNTTLGYISKLGKVSQFYQVKESTIQLFDNNRENAVGNSIKHLTTLGYKPTIENGDVFIDENDFQKIHSLIEEDVKAIGGLTFLNLISKKLSCYKYDKKQERVHITIPIDHMGYKFKPSLPLGYLFNLCLKFINQENKQPNYQSSLDRLSKLSISILSALDVEPYSSWESEFKKGNGLLSLIADIALLDSNFKIPQLRPSDLPLLLKGLFSWIRDESLDTDFPINFNDIISSSEKFQHLLRRPTQLQIIKNKEFTPNHFSKNKRKCIYNIFVHKDKPNIDFKSPIDWHKVDAVFKPFFRYNNSKSIIPLSEFSSLATLEAVQSYFRQELKKMNIDFDKEMGCKVEDFVRETLTKKNISFSNGNYKTSENKNAEIDIAIETEKIIYLIEIKKKPLTRLSKSGNQFQLLIDIAKSLVKSQIQMLNHEITLLKNKQILFNHGDIIQLNNRSIEKVTVTLLDFGGLQDRTIIRQLLFMFHGASFSCPDSRFKVDIEYLNEKSKEFHDLYDEAIKLYGTPPNIHFFNTWFLSLPQFLIILDDVNSTSDLVASFMNTRNMTTKSLDFYYEHSYMKGLRSK